MILWVILVSLSSVYILSSSPKVSVKFMVNVCLLCFLTCNFFFFWPTVYGLVYRLIFPLFFLVLCMFCFFSFLVLPFLVLLIIFVLVFYLCLDKWGWFEDFDFCLGIWGYLEVFLIGRLIVESFALFVWVFTMRRDSG